MADISVDLFGMKLKNPVMPAAGPNVKDARSAQAAAAGGAGALVTKTISTEAARVPRPNMAQTASGFMNAELWSELSPEQWLEKEYPDIREIELPLIAGLGYREEDIKTLAPKLEKYADALELSTHYLAGNPAPMKKSIKAAKAAVEIPVMVKLSPQIDVVKFARSAEKAGADGIVLVNSLGPTLDIDLKTALPLMGSENGYGWLSGNAIFPFALRCVFEVAGAVEIPVIGVGGISRGREAVKMLMAGAQAVQVCTEAILNGPEVYGEIAGEIKEFLDENNYNDITEIRGLAHTNRVDQANYKTIIPEIDQEKCTGCGLCIKSCVYEAIEKNQAGKAEIYEEKCHGCGLCVTRCDFEAINLFDRF